MRTKLIIGAVAFGIGLAAPASAEEWDFILKNSTGKAVKTVQLAPGGTGEWKPGKVDSEITEEGLRDGDRTSVGFDKAAKKCVYDVMLTFDDASSAMWPGINICNGTSFTFGKDGKPVPPKVG